MASRRERVRKRKKGHKDNKQVESGLEVADFVSFSAPAVRLLSHM
jgi:hypothetical protein